MALRLSGDAAVQGTTSTIVYAPGLADTGDMEPGTRGITATSRPSTADYSASMVVPAPPDPRLAVLRLGLRVRVGIAGFSGSPAATTLFYAVRVNGTDRLTGSWTTSGTQTVAEDLTAGMFALGSPNLVELFLWTDRGQVDINLVQLWMAVGSRQLSSNLSGGVVQVLHRGPLSLSARVEVSGSGSPALALAHPQSGWVDVAVAQGPGAHLRVPCLIADDHLLTCYGSLSTDLNYVRSLTVTLEELG